MDFTFASEEIELRQKTRNFAEKEIAPIAEELDAAYDYHEEGINRVKKSGFFAYVVPKAYGGKGISSVNLCIIREELAKVSTFADEAFIMQGLGSNPIARFGNEKQKSKYMPPLIDGSKMANFCLTEQSSGSDVAGIQATARREGDFYVLNGRKWYSPGRGIPIFQWYSQKQTRRRGARGSPLSSSIGNSPLMGQRPCD